MAASPSWRREQTGLLQERLIVLAGTPDDSSLIGDDLVLIARLVADRIAAVDYASVTSRYEGAYATVAASSDLAVAVDEAQYRDETGPCLEALDGKHPTAVPDIAATMTWPGFREKALRLGLKASLSIPLFAGSGQIIGALNLYGRHAGPMKALTAAVWGAYEPSTSVAGNHDDDLDDGGRELAAGLIGAMALRDMIQQAIGVIMATTGRNADCAYFMLRMQAAESGATLTDTAVHFIEQEHA
ncbi:GAF and ANTAR domain-containing protein [Actinoplanes sp. NPDC026619]|uniref:GAF and ANTAR domain-containing protein n=1 Tax=Actinoplanes sp. NPDC026619 TaxID=3155798 RepID=UPI0033F051C7